MDIAPPGIANFRDLGGHPTRDGGRVRRGLVYRSTDLRALDAAGAAALRSLGIRAVYDLRSDMERDAWPERDHLPPEMAYVVADVLADVPDENPAAYRAAFADPEAAARAFGDGRAITFFEAKYRQFVTLPSARAAYHDLFAGLARADGRPALFHCTTGKDRTGWAAAVLLLLLDVPEDEIAADYLASNGAMLPEMRGVVDAFVARGGDPALLEPMVGVRRRYLDTAVAEMQSRFRDVEGYLTDGLGLDEAAITALRTALVEPAGA